MFDVGFFEVVLLFVIGLLILGPERLPRVATQIGRWVGRARRTANQLRHQIEREVALNDLRKPPAYRPPPSGDESSESKADETASSAAEGDDTTAAQASGDDAANESAAAPDRDASMQGEKSSSDT